MTPAPVSPVQRPTPATGGTDFGVRMIASLVLTLVVVSGLQLVLATAQVERRVLDSQAEAHRVGAEALAAAYAGAGQADPMGEVAKVVQFTAQRAGVEEVRLLDPALAVVAGSPAAGGRSTVAPAAFADRGAVARQALGPDGRYAFGVPVDLGGGPYVLEIEQRLAAVAGHGGYLRWQALELVLIGLLVGLPIFYLVGGRSLQRQHRRARDEALLDGLTGLANHRAFHEEVHRAARQAARDGAPLTLVMLDIDEFKLVNDSRGHQYGDSLLLAMVDVLRAVPPPSGDGLVPAFRLGGDEFALLLPGRPASCARVSAEEIRDRVADRLGGATVSIGLSTLEDSGDAALLVEQAHAALYEAKRLGRNRTVSYGDLRGSALIATPAQVAATRRLIAEGDLEVLFQPIVDLHHDRVLGYEALMRPAGAYGIAGPTEAFDVAEKIGHAVELDERCRTAALSASAALPPDILLFLNLHPRELERNGELGAALEAAVRHAGRRPEQIVLELTERTDARLDALVPAARALRSRGFRLAVDDVGEGNSGLEVLRRLPVDYVKISRDVVAGALTDREARGVLHAILAFAHESGVYTIAEGIETPSMLELVRHPAQRGVAVPRGVHAAQGYLLGKPQRLPAVGASRGPAGVAPVAQLDLRDPAPARISAS